MQLIRADQDYLDASLWRTRLTTGLYTVATYYKMAGELLALAVKILEKAPLAGSDLIKQNKRAEAIMLLGTTVALLNDAAKFMGMAGTELGNDEERWNRCEAVIKAILKKETGDEKNGSCI